MEVYRNRQKPAETANREQALSQPLATSWMSVPSFLALWEDFECEENVEDLELPESIEETSALVSKTS